MTESTNNLLPMRFDNKEIDKENPWSDDELGLEKFVDVLTNRVKGGVSPYTISVNGEWGTGKTFMLQRWRQQLENESYKAIYYNAWEDDFCVNPLVSIIGQIATEIEDKSLKILIDDIKEIANSLLSKKTVRFSLIKKIINSPLIKKIAKSFLVKKFQAYVGMTIKESQPEINNIIDEYSKQTVQTKELKKSLEKLTTKIEKDTGHPLIFIIDELDRCRPTFAIEILERIKHLFNIPGIIFVLGMNRTVLEKSITHVYGDIGSEEYLRRFCDIPLTLIAPKSSDYYLHLINKYKTVVNIDGSITSTEYCSDVFDYMKLSLRDTEYCFRALGFILIETKKLYGNEAGWATTCLIVILLRIKNHTLYWRFIQEKSSCIEIINDICESIPNENDKKINIINDIVIKGIYSLANDAERENIIRHAKTYKKHSSPTSISSPQRGLSQRALPQRALSQIETKGEGYFHMRYENNALQKIASSLDLVQY